MRRRNVGAGPGDGLIGVLVVDDDEATVRTTLRLLKQHGYFAAGFTTAAEVLERNAADPYQIVLLDIALDEGKSGIEIGEVLRDRGFEGQIIAMSGTTDREVKAAALRRAADQFVMKGDGPEVLLASVAAAARRCGAHLRNKAAVRMRGPAAAKSSSDSHGIGPPFDEVGVTRHHPEDASGSIPRSGCGVLISSPLGDDRHFLGHYALSLGWDVSLRSDIDVAGKPMDPAVVVVVMRPPDARAGASALRNLRQAHYTRDIAYLAASSAPEECEQAAIRGATWAVSNRPALDLIEFFAGVLNEARIKYPARLRFSPFELDVEERRVWLLENGKQVEVRLTHSLFGALELLVRACGRDVPIERVSEASGTTKNASAQRKLISGSAGPCAHSAPMQSRLVRPGRLV